MADEIEESTYGGILESFMIKFDNPSMKFVYLLTIILNHLLSKYIKSSKSDQIKIVL